MGLIYLDACLLSYAVEEHPDHAPLVRARLEAAAADNRFAISPLVTLECLVKPIRDANTALERRYRQAFDTFEMLPMGAEVFEQAATLRGRFGIRTPDALHLACAQVHGCEYLLTNDERLRKAGHGSALSIHRPDDGLPDG